MTRTNVRRGHVVMNTMGSLQRPTPRLLAGEHCIMMPIAAGTSIHAATAARASRGVPGSKQVGLTWGSSTTVMRRCSSQATTCCSAACTRGEGFATTNTVDGALIHCSFNVAPAAPSCDFETA